MKKKILDNNSKKLEEVREASTNISTAKYELKIDKFLKDIDFDSFVKEKLDSIFKEVLEQNTNTFLQRKQNQKTKKIFSYTSFNQFHQYIKIFLETFTVDDEIIQTIYKKIRMTTSTKSISKIKLTSYHLLLNYLSIFSQEFSKKHNIKITPQLFLFLPEIASIIAEDEELSAFSYCIYSITEKLLNKYENTSRLNTFYYNIILKNSYFFIEKISKGVLTTVLANKNPLTIRHIFGTYTSIIKKNISLKLKYNINNFKIIAAGNITESLEEEDEIIKRNQVDYIDILVNYQAMKKHNNTSIDVKLYPNMFDFVHKYDQDLSLLDYSLLYMKWNEFLEKDDHESTKWVKVSHKIRSGKTSSWFNEKFFMELIKKLKKTIKDENIIIDIYKAISKSIAIQFDMNSYVDKYFKPIGSKYLSIIRDESDDLVTKFMSMI